MFGKYLLVLLMIISNKALYFYSGFHCMCMISIGLDPSDFFFN